MPPTHYSIRTTLGNHNPATSKQIVSLFLNGINLQIIENKAIKSSQKKTNLSRSTSNHEAGNMGHTFKWELSLLPILRKHKTDYQYYLYVINDSCLPMKLQFHQKNPLPRHEYSSWILKQLTMNHNKSDKKRRQGYKYQPWP